MIIILIINNLLVIKLSISYNLINLGIFVLLVITNFSPDTGQFSVELLEFFSQSTG